MLTRSLARRLAPAVVLTAAIGLALAGCGDDNDSASSDVPSPSKVPDRGKVTVVQAGFTENNILAQAYAALLEKYGYSVTVKTVPNRETYSPELAKGSVDIAPDYLASAANYYNAEKTGKLDVSVATSDVAETLATLKTYTDPLGLTVLKPSTATDQNAFAVTEDYATTNDLESLSDLGESGQAVVLASTQECPSRPLCGVALERTYGIDVTKNLPFAFGSPAAKKQVTDGKAQLVLVATTDATLADDGLVVLEDDKKVQPAENLVPIIGKGSPLADDAEVVDALNKFSEGLTTAELAALNAQVDVERRKASAVAEEYLTTKGLI